jgi:riboflavin synthase
VIDFDDASMSFDVVQETLEKTKLGSLKKDDAVNLERSMRADGRFEGHVVQGHVEGTAKVMEPGEMLTIELPSAMLPHVVQKGSITIDGVSLTVASLDGNRCTVALIPHTLKMTTLGNLRKNDDVNIETDILARYSRPSHA